MAPPDQAHINNANELVASARERGLQQLIDDTPAHLYRDDMTEAEVFTVFAPITQLCDELCAEAIALTSAAGQRPLRRAASQAHLSAWATLASAQLSVLCTNTYCQRLTWAHSSCSDYQPCATSSRRLSWQHRTRRQHSPAWYSIRCH